MKRIVLMVLAGVFFLAANVQANCGKCGIGDAPKAGHGHEEMSNEEMAAKKLEGMTKDLKLSDEQQAQVKALMAEKMDKKTKLMEEKKAAMEAIHTDFKTKLGAILSPEQMKTWEAKQEKMQEKMKDRKDGMKGKCPHCEKGKLCPMCEKMHKKGADKPVPVSK